MPDVWMPIRPLQDMIWGEVLINMLRKRVITFIFALVLLVSVSTITVLAAGSITASYSNGRVTYSGSGFDPDTEFVIRLLSPDQSYLISMLPIVTDGYGNFDVGVDVGTLENGTYYVHVNDSRGNSVASTTFQVTGGNGGGGDNGGDDGDGAGDGGSGGSSGGGRSGSGSGGRGGGSSSVVDDSDLGEFIGAQVSAEEAVSQHAGEDAGIAATSNQPQSFGRVPQTNVPGITGFIVAGITAFMTLTASCAIMYQQIVKCKRSARVSSNDSQR